MRRHFALIPAAGYGARMGSATPKQYLPLNGRPMIYHALKRLADAPEIQAVFVVLAPDDPYWSRYDWESLGPKLRPLFCGGGTRAESVFNGLRAMEEVVEPSDWVLVHDAARPCLSREALTNLMLAVQDEAGGLLAIPVADTLKRDDGAGRVVETAPRDGLWQAQTPQMFPHSVLLRALESMDHEIPTDESRAVERLGYHPRLVPSDGRNLKVTYAWDLVLAQLILSYEGA